MSLFPSASSLHDMQANTKNQDWLENKSFDTNAVDVLKKDQDLRNKLSSNITELSSVTKDLLDSEESVSDVDGNDNLVQSNESPEKVQILDMHIDKTPCKDNVYFNKPYKIFIPKYYRGSIACVGLIPYLRIPFEKKRKRKGKQSRPVEPRYYQADEDLMLNNQDQNVSESLKKHMEKLNVETRENKENIDCWLKLVSLQDELPGKNLKFKAEKKISILDKAISANPRNYDLKLKRLDLLESIAEDSEREWKNLVFNHPECVETWEAYIRRTLTNPRFTFSRSLKVFEKCLETLSSIRNQSHRSSEIKSSIETDMLKIFAMLIKFMAEAGHNERAVTLLLLMLEINVRTKNCENLSDVKDFYESGVPLLGETDSKGWDEWFKKFQRGGWIETHASKSGFAAEPEEDVDELMDVHKSLSENWLKLEYVRSCRDLFPWRSEDDCEDPDRKVAFDDLKGFLFLVNKDFNRLKILDTFYQLLGASSQNEFVSSKLEITQPSQLSLVYHNNNLLGDISPIQSITCLKFSNYEILPRIPHHELLRMVFEQLTMCSGCMRRLVASSCLCYYLTRMSFLNQKDEPKGELKKTYKEARSIAKTFLKSDPGDYLVWSKLARIEHFAKRCEESKKITFNALCMCRELSDALLLCRSYSELNFTADKEAVTKVLIAFGDDRNFTAYLQNGKELTSATYLRASRSLERTCEELSCVYRQVEVSLTLEPSSFANAFCCFVLFNFVTSSVVPHHLFRQYLQVFRKAKNDGNKQSLIDLRLIHELNINLLPPDYKHNNLYRNALLSALDDISNHPPFLLKLCQVEIGSSITSVARRVFGNSSDPVHVFFSVYFELLRFVQIDETITPPRVLNILERFLSLHPNHVLLWRIYAKLSKNPELVLTRACAKCPWSKQLACDRILVEKDKIEDIVSLMQDKGLRVRTPVEEIRLLLTI